MSDYEKENFVYLNEHEWRIVHTHFMTEKKLLVKKGLKTPEYKVPIEIGDVRVIVFPDIETKKMAMEDDIIKSLIISVFNKMPILITVIDCLNI